MDLQAQLMSELAHKKALSKSKQNELDYLSYMKSYSPRSVASGSAAPIAKSSPDVATAAALAGGANPLSLALVRKQLGDQDYIGYCEKFVEQTEYGRTGLFPSAADAWTQQQDKAIQGLSGVQPGDAVYFADPSQPYGHTGIYAGGNQFISATDSGIQQNDIDKWLQSTGQQLLGYIPGGKNGN